MDSSQQGPNVDPEHAPSFAVPARRLGALEHPMIIKNVDKAIETFGRNYAPQAVCHQLKWTPTFY